MRYTDARTTIRGLDLLYARALVFLTLDPLAVDERQLAQFEDMSNEVSHAQEADHYKQEHRSSTSSINYEVAAALTLYSLRVDGYGKWLPHQTKIEENSRLFEEEQRSAKRHKHFYLPRPISANDFVQIHGAAEGRAMNYNGLQGRVISHRAKSPWFLIKFDDGNIIPVRSQCLRRMKR